MNDVKARLKLPAMGLIAVGLVNALLGVLSILQMLVALTRGEPASRVFESDERRMGYMIGFFV